MNKLKISLLSFQVFAFLFAYTIVFYPNMILNINEVFLRTILGLTSITIVSTSLVKFAIEEIKR